MKQKDIDRLVSYAISRGYKELADDFSQWVALQHLRFPDSGYPKKNAHFLLTDFLRMTYSGGRIIQSNENKFRKAKGEELKRANSAWDYKTWLSLANEDGEEYFAGQDESIDERIDFMKTMREIKRYVRDSHSFSPSEKMIFELVLTGLKLKEMSPLLEVSDSYVSILFKSLLEKLNKLRQRLERGENI